MKAKTMGTVVRSADRIGPGFDGYAPPTRDGAPHPRDDVPPSRRSAGGRLLVALTTRHWSTRRSPDTSLPSSRAPPAVSGADVDVARSAPLHQRCTPPRTTAARVTRPVHAAPHQLVATATKRIDGRPRPARSAPRRSWRITAVREVPGCSRRSVTPFRLTADTARYRTADEM